MVRARARRIAYDDSELVDLRLDSENRLHLRPLCFVTAYTPTDFASCALVCDSILSCSSTSGFQFCRHGEFANTVVFDTAAYRAVKA